MEYGALLEWWEEKIEVLGRQPVQGLTQKQHLVIQRNENRVLCNKIIHNRWLP